MRWHKWEDGLFPELERWDLATVGAFHLIRANYWRTGQVPVDADDATCMLDKDVTYSMWERLVKVIPRMVEYLSGTVDPDLSAKRSAAAKKMWEKRNMQVHTDLHASALQHVEQNQIQSQNQNQNQNTPPTPSRGTEPKKPKRIKRTRNPFPLENCGDKNAEEAFDYAVGCWPSQVTGWDDRVRSEVTIKPSLGDLGLARQYFAQLIAEGHATAQELYVCAWLATNRWKETGHIWIPNVSTFYGPKKESWTAYITEARKVIKEQDSAA